MTKVNIKRSTKVPSRDWWYCGEDYGYGLFKKEKPKDVAIRLIKTVFADKDISNMCFVYVPRYYRGGNNLQDSIDVYYREDGPMVNMSKHRAKRISAGHYIYRGFEITCVGYYHPEHCVCWEATDNYGCGFAHGFSLAMTKELIDNELDNKE